LSEDSFQPLNFYSPLEYKFDHRDGFTFNERWKFYRFQTRKTDTPACRNACLDAVALACLRTCSPNRTAKAGTPARGHGHVIFQMMRRLTPVQGLTLFFLIGLILLALIFRGQILLWRSLLLRYTILLGLLFALKLSSDRKSLGKMGKFFYHFSPILFVILIYESLGDLIQYLQPDIDSYLIQIDFFIFRVHPTLWMEQWIVPWFTDMMSLAYLSYYFIPVVLIAVLYLKGQTVEFEQSIFVLAFGYYISFIGYILFPAIGPRYALTHLYTVPLEGSFITDFVRDTLNALEHNKRDCMPSGHTQLVLIVLYLAYRYKKFLFYLFLPIICGLILSTVYLRYHYVIDLFAGALFAVGCMIVGPRLYRYWNGEGGR
jgi:membrane-associated phospholipid phosphatase